MARELPTREPPPAHGEGLSPLAHGEGTVPWRMAREPPTGEPPPAHGERTVGEGVVPLTYLSALRLSRLSFLQRQHDEKRDDTQERAHADVGQEVGSQNHAAGHNG